MNNKDHHPEALFRVRGSTVFWGPGLQELLGRIQVTGSIKRAAQEMYMSYSKARRLIAIAEEELGYPVVESHSGGSARGSTRLTAEGLRCYQLYETIQQEVQDHCERRFRELLTPDR
ncbi:MAG: LysR family transcriptional regulator [Mogibacterium sp.]|nr:LysR family transcriptional regulator [Mogibacterium sp.]